MIYDLKLDQPVGTFISSDYEPNVEIKKSIDKIDSFEKKLVYYNDHICSLSLSPMDGKIYYKTGVAEQTIKIYCGCNNCRKHNDFNHIHEQIFLKLREREVSRIVQEIKKRKSYKQKLQFLFSVNGYHANNYNTQVYGSYL